MFTIPGTLWRVWQEIKGVRLERPRRLLEAVKAIRFRARTTFPCQEKGLDSRGDEQIKFATEKHTATASIAVANFKENEG